MNATPALNEVLLYFHNTVLRHSGKFYIFVLTRPIVVNVFGGVRVIYC